MVILLHPQEIEVFYLLPAIRNAIAQALKKQGKSQRDIALLLGVTESAVSQYLSGKRGADERIPEELTAMAELATKNITDQQSLIRETQAILAKAKQTKLTCKLHERISKDVPHGCDICFKEAKQ